MNGHVVAQGTAVLELRRDRGKELSTVTSCVIDLVAGLHRWGGFGGAFGGANGAIVTRAVAEFDARDRSRSDARSLRHRAKDGVERHPHAIRFPESVVENQHVLETELVLA